jgi:hypothetical protein
MSRYVSFVIRSWQDDHDGTMRWEAHRVHDEAEIRLPEAAFVVRAWVDDDEHVLRGLIHHVQSGREMQFQSGERALDFIRTCLGREPVSEHDLERLEIEGLSDGQTL